MRLAPPQRPPSKNLLSAILSWPEPPPASNCVRNLAFSPDGRQLAIASGDTIVRLIAVATGKEKSRFPLGDRALQALRWTSSGRLVAAGVRWHDSMQSVVVWDVESGKCLQTFAVHDRKPAPGSITTSIGVGPVTWSPDGRLLIGEGPADDTVHTWDVVKGESRIAATAPARTPGLFAIAPDSKCFVSGGLGGQPIRLWDLASGRERFRLDGLQHSPHEFAFSPDGALVASALADNAIHLWQVASGKEVHRLQGHRAQTCFLAISPDGRLLASGSEDKTVRLWEIATGKPIYVWGGHTGPIACAPDVRTVASGSLYGTVILWDLTGAHDVPPIRAAAADDLDRLWSNLKDGDAATAHRALWALAASPQHSVPSCAGSCLRRRCPTQHGSGPGSGSWTTTALTCARRRCASCARPAMRSSRICGLRCKTASAAWRHGGASRRSSPN
jgi:WD40 repeat protein